MNQKFDALDFFLRFSNLLEIKRGFMAKNGWWRKGSKEEDEMVSHAADELIAGVCDADKVTGVKGELGINLRDQVTIEELEDWHKDRQLRRMGNRN